MSPTLRAALMIGVIALITAALRFLPFLVFKNRVPKFVLYLGEVLPFAIMGMLVVFCLRELSVLSYPYGVPEGIAVTAVVLLHKWKHNTLLSVLGGTVLYMVLIQLVF